MSTKRLAVIGTEAQSHPLIASSERVVDVECVRAARDSGVGGVDAVACCGRHDNSVSAICDLARRGMHLLVDLATLRTTADVVAMIAACGEADVQLMIVAPRRFLPLVQAVRQSLDAGQLGAPGLLRIHRWVAQRDRELDQLLLDEIDLAIYLFDGPPTSVYAVARDGDRSPRFLQVHLGFEDGGMALVDVTTGLPEGDDYYSLSLIGGDGSAYADDHHNVQLLYGGGPAVAKRSRDDALLWIEPLRQFAAALDQSGDMTVGSDSALAALRVVSAARRAIESGDAMQWQGGDYEPA